MIWLPQFLWQQKHQHFFAPGMNVNMWENPIVKKNFYKLKDIGYRIINHYTES